MTDSRASRPSGSAVPDRAGALPEKASARPPDDSSLPPVIETFQFLVSESETGMRLDRFLADKLKDHGLSREKIKTLLRHGKVTVNGRAADSPKKNIFSGDSLTVLLEAQPPALPEPETGTLDILYQDAELVVLNKAAGIAVHPAPGRHTGTLAQILLSHFPELAAQKNIRPGIAHRLDMDTSGLILVALTERSLKALSAGFANREIHKEYLALVKGVPERAEETIDAPIGRHPTVKTKMAIVPGGKAAMSVRKTLYADPEGRFSLQAVRIFSGRPHQVRVHMRHIGHPLLGDSLYASDSAPKTRSSSASSAKKASLPPACRAKRQMLHAWKLSFRHPFPPVFEEAGSLPFANNDEPLLFCCPPPQDFSDTVRDCISRCLRVAITGSPGCGKSLLLHFFQDRGYPVFSADAEVARLYGPGGDAARLLRSAYGDRFVPEHGAAVDKTALGAAMREDASVRREIEALIHPLVWHAALAFWQEHAHDAALAVAEIPLYLESGREHTHGAQTTSPILVGVQCPFEQRRMRLEQLRGWNAETISAMERWQWPEEKKMQACDHVLDNSGSLDDFYAGADTLLKTLLALHHERSEAVLRELRVLWSACHMP